MLYRTPVRSAIGMSVVKGGSKRSNAIFVGQVEINVDRETRFPYYPEWVQCFTNKETHAVYTASPYQPNERPELGCNHVRRKSYL